jgi:hypothetical protein
MMSHSKKTADVSRQSSGDAAWTSSDAARDWDVDTHVMPPEYSRQLLEISRQLQYGK